MIQSIPLKLILMLSSNSNLLLSRRLLSSSFPAEILCAFLLNAMSDMFHVNLALSDLRSS